MTWKEELEQGMNAKARELITMTRIVNESVPRTLRAVPAQSAEAKDELELMASRVEYLCAEITVLLCRGS